MNPAIAAARARLERLRDALRAEGDLAIDPGHDGEVVVKPDDDAAPLHEMNQAIASSRNRERTVRLQQIEHALARLGADPEAFGRCEACDEPIVARRLELMPWARLCIECQAERERDGPRGRRHLTDYQ